ncbi:MAG TPA: protein TolR [Syntrophaceae bacterium]|nr:protein TolR [Syntrophaceae bacterium]
MENKRLLSDINVTPLVDVMLVLLIIFMVTAPMMMQGIDVNLPETRSQAFESHNEAPLVITITEKREILLNDYKTDLGTLGKKLKAICGNRAHKEVFLRADKRVPYGFVVKVMDRIKNAGIEKLGMVTEPLETKRT